MNKNKKRELEEREGKGEEIARKGLKKGESRRKRGRKMEDTKRVKKRRTEEKEGERREIARK